MSAQLAWFLLAAPAAWSLHDIAAELRRIRRHLDRQERKP